MAQDGHYPELDETFLYSEPGPQQILKHFDWQAAKMSFSSGINTQELGLQWDVFCEYYFFWNPILIWLFALCVYIIACFFYIYTVDTLLHFIDVCKLLRAFFDCKGR